MGYSDKVLDHYDNPRNVGTLDKNDENVGTGLVGAPACGDVMRLQVRIEEKVVGAKCRECGATAAFDGGEPTGFTQPCGHDGYDLLLSDVIADAKFKTFGCGSAIASSSLVTEWVKGMAVSQALEITNGQVAEELSLPPVKIHCSVLAEDAVKAAIADFKKKRQARDAARAAPRPEMPPPPQQNDFGEPGPAPPDIPPTPPPPQPLPPEYPATPVAEDGSADPHAPPAPPAHPNPPQGPLGLDRRDATDDEGEGC